MASAITGGKEHQPPAYPAWQLIHDSLLPCEAFSLVSVASASPGRPSLTLCNGQTAPSEVFKLKFRRRSGVVRRATPLHRVLRNVSDHSLRFVNGEASKRLASYVAERLRLQERSSNRFI